MADEMENLETNDDGGGSKRKRVSGASGLVKLLTIIIGVILFLLVTVTVSVLTVNIMNSSNASDQLKRSSDDYIGMPDYDYAEAFDIRGHTSDRVPRTFMITVVLGYDQGDDKTVGEIARRRSQLQDLMRTFFSEKQVEDFNNEQQVKAELQQRINRILSQGRIKTILFTEVLMDYR